MNNKTWKKISGWAIGAIVVGVPAYFIIDANTALFVPNDFGPKQKLKAIDAARDSVKIYGKYIKWTDKELKDLYADAAKNHEYEEINLGTANCDNAYFLDKYSNDSVKLVTIVKIDAPKLGEATVVKDTSEWKISWGNYEPEMVADVFKRIVSEKLAKEGLRLLPFTATDEDIHRGREVPLVGALGAKSEIFAAKENELIMARKRFQEALDRNNDIVQKSRIYWGGRSHYDCPLFANEHEDGGDKYYYYGGTDVRREYAAQQEQFKAARKLESERNAMRQKINSYQRKNCCY